MNMHEQLVVTPTAWAHGAGNDTDVVVSSRIRLARNFAAQRFPNKQDREEAMQVWKHLSDFAAEHSDYQFYRLDDADSLDKEALLAKHLISPAHAANDERLRALVLNNDLTQAIMVNEEDHLRMQTFRRGFDLGDAWQSATLLDDQIGKYGDYAFTDRLGYLTSCPTNIGTGLSASVMLHLPAMTASRQTGLLQQVTKAGMTVRGFFGEGTEATGDLYQLSNQVTLGRSEEDILAGLSATTKQVVDMERKLREGYREQGEAFTDQCYRALGTLTYARRISSKEAYQLLSLIRLGASLGMLSGWTLDQVDKLFIMAHPGYVQFANGKALTDAERDRARAELIRKEILPG